MREAVQLTLSLDEIAADIHVVWAETKAHQIAAWEGYWRIGGDLSAARERFGEDDRGFGRWCAAQHFGFSQQWGHRLRTIFERGDREELLTSALVSRPPGVDTVYARLTAGEKDRSARQINGGGADVEAERWNILAGDFRERLVGLDGSAALIITDPPYPEEFADLWTDLAVHAKRILRPGGIAAVMSGKIHVDDRMRRLGEHLAYGWIYCQLLPGENTRVLARHVLQEWKPWLCYSNGPWPSGRVDWNGDLLTAGPKAKDRYHWQQQLDPAVELIERLTEPSDLVVDPFCGSGTFGIAALRAGRRFVGVEADAGRVAVAAAALREAAA